MTMKTCGGILLTFSLYALLQTQHAFSRTRTFFASSSRLFLPVVPIRRPSRYKGKQRKMTDECRESRPGSDDAVSVRCVT